jgi:hypothetical protein
VSRCGREVEGVKGKVLSTLADRWGEKSRGAILVRRFSDRWGEKRRGAILVRRHMVAGVGGPDR